MRVCVLFAARCHFGGLFLALGRSRTYRPEVSEALKLGLHYAAARYCDEVLKEVKPAVDVQLGGGWMWVGSPFTFFLGEGFPY